MNRVIDLSIHRPAARVGVYSTETIDSAVGRNIPLGVFPLQIVVLHAKFDPEYLELIKGVPSYYAVVAGRLFRYLFGMFFVVDKQKDFSATIDGVTLIPRKLARELYTPAHYNITST